MPLKIFLSYPSDHADRVAEVSYALEAEGHSVFFDRDRLPAGAGYHARIRRAVEESDLFIFFITPESVAPGRYTLTELKFARAKWENPEDRLLPVLLVATPLDKVPAYLKAVTILAPEGNLPAEVAARVAELADRGPAESPPAGEPPPPGLRPGPQLQAPSYGALRIAFRGGGESGYPLEVTESPGGAIGAQPCRIDPGEVESLLWSPGESRRAALRQPAPQAALPTPEGARRVGERLYETLFATHLRDTLEASLRQLDPQRGVGVRFVINTTDAPELSGIPWEFTYRKSDEDFLFSDRLTPVVRWLDLERPLPTLAVEPPLRLLVAVASPSDQPALSVGEELASLGNELGELAADGILEPIHLDHTSLEKLDKALVDNAPHVLHFIGHGDFQAGEGVLLLESEESPGASAPLTGRRLAVLLRNHLTSLRLVFLNSCLGAAVASRNPFSGVAQSLMRRGMPAVIAMQFPIPDRAAVALAREFYRYLAAGLPVDAALTSARAFLFAKGYEVEWGAPALHMRTPDARLFAIPGAPEPVVAAPPPAPSPPAAEPPVPVTPAAGQAPPGPYGRLRRPLVLTVVLAVIAVALGVLGVGYLALRSGPDEPGGGGVEPRPDDGGATAVAVPDLIGRPLEEVLQELEERGLSPGGVEYWPSDRQPAGTVLEMNPAPGSRVRRGSEIHLVVAQPPVRAAPVSWLTVHKRVLGDREGGISPADFSLLVDGRPVASGERLEVAPGRHAVSERGGPPGYRAAFSGDCDAAGRVELAAGEEKSCTLTNDYAAAARAPAFCEQLLGTAAGACFAPEPVGSLAELQALFERYRDDLRVVLDKSGWEGDPDDLFEAVRQAREGDATVTRRSVRPGETFRWMAYRKGGRPDVLREPRWSGEAPYGAWQIEVESAGRLHLFVVPGSCLCPAYDGSMALVAPSCDLEASFDAAADVITVIGKSDAESFKITSIQVPGGAGSLADLESTGALQWSYRPTADGTYRFNAEATTDGRSSSCSATVQVTRAKPVCSLDSTVDPETRMITVDASGSRGEFALTGVSLPDGTAGRVGELTSVGEQRWSYDPSASLRKKPGSYSYTFSGESRLHGFESTCETTAVITREAPEFRWIARGYPLWVEPSASGDGERVSIDGGPGLGLGVEYRFAPRLGVEAAIAVAELEIDRDGGSEELRYRQLTTGLNVHLTPDRRLDLYVGPVVGLLRLGGQFDEDLAWGAGLGIDLPLGGRWWLTGGLRWLESSVEAGAAGGDLELDPLILSVGLSRRF